MAASSSNNNNTIISNFTTPVAVVASSSTAVHDGGLVSSHSQSSQIILSNALPPANTIRGGGGHGGSISIHSAASVPPANCHHITLTDVKSGELVPLLINHHHDHHLNHHHETYQYTNLADSSTLVDTTTSSIITTTAALSEPANHGVQNHHHSQLMNIMNEIPSSSIITTSALVHPSASTNLNTSHSVLMKIDPPLASMSNHNNNNTIIYETTTGPIPLTGVAVPESPLIACSSSAASSGEFLQQCPSNQLVTENLLASRVIVTQSTATVIPPTTVENSNSSFLGESNRELHDLTSVICSVSAAVDNNCGQSLQQVHSHSQSQTQKIKRVDKSCSTDNLNLSVSTNDNSLSSSTSDESDDIDLNDEKITDEGGGYQDNTSSNSQQSGGGGSVSGGVAGGIGSSSYGSLIQPSIGQSGGIVSGHSVSGNFAGGPGGIGGHGGGGGGGLSAGGGGPHHGVSGQTGPIQTNMGEQTDFKYLFEELCPVCGDKVSGYHYGLLTCESCKGFFKRTVQNKKVYTCVAERRCLIDKTQRKRCPYCRFQKCLDVGMKLEAVRADRMRGGRNKFGPMYKRDRARKLQMMRQRQLALQAIRGSMNTGDLKPGQLSPTGYQQSYPSMSIKQEIQIPQVSSLTQSPDSSPSPIAIALGQVNPSTAITATTLSGSSANTTTVSGAGGGSGSCGPGSDNGSSSLQHSSDSKICFDSGTNPSSTADSVELRVSPMIREFVQSVDDREWQTQLFTLLQKQSYNQVEVDLFELMCKVLDQNLFSQVDWARNTVFFKDLKVDDQMKLLQFSWSDMLVLDHLHQRIHNGLPDETPLHNGQIFNLLNLGLLGVPQLGDYFNELQNKLQELKFDMGDYVCMKFLILLNPNVRGIVNRKCVLEGHENVQAALLDYTLTCYPSVTDKFSRLLNILPEIHAMATRGEEHLYIKHCAGSAPTQTLLMEMLHAKRKV